MSDCDKRLMQCRWLTWREYYHHNGNLTHEAMQEKLRES